MSSFLRYHAIPPGKYPVQLAREGLKVPSILQSWGKFNLLQLLSLKSGLKASASSFSRNSQPSFISLASPKEVCAFKKGEQPSKKPKKTLLKNNYVSYFLFKKSKLGIKVLYLEKI